MSNDQPVVLDSAIHHAIKEMAQAIADEHGITILDVRIEWHTDRPMSGKPTYRVYEVEVRTRSA